MRETNMNYNSHISVYKTFDFRIYKKFEKSEWKQGHHGSHSVCNEERVVLLDGLSRIILGLGVGDSAIRIFIRSVE